MQVGGGFLGQWWWCQRDPLSVYAIRSGEAEEEEAFVGQ